MAKLCAHDGCDKPMRAKGLCMIHYYRDKRAREGALRRSKKTARQQEVIEEAMRLILGAGYVKRRSQERPNKYKFVRIAEHRLVVERALGKALPTGAIVHHVNADPADNRPCNLVVCPDHRYHMLLHSRQRDFNYEGTKS